MKSSCLKAALVGLIAISGTAEALPREEGVNVTVEYGDLDLGTPAGIATLNRRVRAAALAMCQDRFFRPGLRGSLPRRRCFAEAIESAEAQIAQAIADQAGRTLASRP